MQQFALATAERKLEPSTVVTSIREQIHSTGWGKTLEKLQGKEGFPSSPSNISCAAADRCAPPPTHPTNPCMTRPIPPFLGHPDHRQTLCVCGQGRIQLGNGGTRVPTFRSDPISREWTRTVVHGDLASRKSLLGCTRLLLSLLRRCELTNFSFCPTRYMHVSGCG